MIEDPTFETEFKFDAPADLTIDTIDAAVAEWGLTCLAGDSDRHRDTYLDDDTGRLRRAGLGLRLRESATTRTLTLKGELARDGARFVRTEHEAPWPDEHLPARATDLPTSLRDRVEPFVSTAALAPGLVLQTLRDRRLLAVAGVPIGELVVDRVRASRGDRCVQFGEVEFELRGSSDASGSFVTRLAERFALQPCTQDKPGRAAALLGDAPVTSTAAPPDTTGPAIATALQRHLADLQHAEAAVRTDDDDEHLHRMRVALRALRSLARAFRDLWSDADATWLLAHLADASRRLGSLRDLDVLLPLTERAVARLPAPLHAPGEVVLQGLRARRDRARAELRDWLRTPAHSEDAERLLALVDASRMQAGAAPAALQASVATRLARAVRSVRKLAAAMPADLPTDPLHELRLAVKRLRHLAEAFADLLQPAARRSLRELTRLQQRLGVVCDREVAVQAMLAEVAEVAATADPLAAAASGGLAALHQAAARKARRRARRLLSRTLRKRLWRRLSVRHDDAAILAS
jgi:triphosphatase